MKQLDIILRQKYDPDFNKEMDIKKQEKLKEVIQEMRKKKGKKKVNI